MRISCASLSALEEEQNINLIGKFILCDIVKIMLYALLFLGSK